MLIWGALLIKLGIRSAQKGKKEAVLTNRYLNTKTHNKSMQAQIIPPKLSYINPFEKTKLKVFHGTNHIGNTVFGFYFAKGNMPELIHTHMQGKKAKFVELPKCFEVEESNSQIGWMAYKIEDGVAVVNACYPKGGAPEVKRLGYYLESIATAILGREYGVKRITTTRNYEDVSKSRLLQLEHVGLQPFTETGIRDWLRGMGTGIREAVEMLKAQA